MPHNLYDPVGAGEVCYATADELREVWFTAWRWHHYHTTGRRSNFGRSYIPRWDGGLDTAGRQYQPLWPRVAAFLAENGVTDIRTFVQAMFDDSRTPPPDPSVLLSASTLASYRKCPDPTRRVADALRVQKNEYGRALHQARLFYPDPSTARLAVLLDRSVSLSALFRFLAADYYQMTNVQAMWFEEALAQYVRNPDGYDRVYGERLDVLRSAFTTGPWGFSRRQPTRSGLVGGA
jgi:hypothetical protein